jgi:hypothetical protein
MAKLRSPAPVARALPVPGDFCCLPISGAVGFGIEVGQWLDGDKFQPYDHAEIFIGQPDAGGPHGYTVSAYPDRRGRLPLPCPPGELPGSLWSSGIISLAGTQRCDIIRWCQEHTAVGYSFADYAALVAHMARLPVPGLRSFIARSDRLICSQYVDTAYAQAGVHLFDDDRWPGYVKPGDLAGLLQSRLDLTVP